MEKRIGIHNRLLGIRGFLPYLLVVLINAIIDLGHKIVIQNTIFKCYDGATQIALTALVNACILLPFILFFTPAGFLADRFSKHIVMRWTAGMAVPLTALIYGSYLLGWFEVAFALTLILAAQSAFYSPAKYGYIKEMAGKDNLGMANGVVQAVTIIAILLGGVLFSVAFEALIGNAQTKSDILHAIAPSGLLLFAGAVAQTVIVWRVPQYKAGASELRLNVRKYLHAEYLKENLRKIHSNRTIWMCVLGLSLFWAVNQVLFAAFGAHLKDVAGVTSTVIAQGLLAIGGIGIIIGSITAGRLSKSYIETGVIPVAAVGMTTCLLLIPGMKDTLALGLLLTVYGFFGGLFVVPLNALIQFNAADEDLGTVLAGNNFVQNVFMLTFLCGTVLASLTGLSSVPIIISLAAVLAVGSAYTLRQLPQSLMRFLLRVLFAQRYRLTVSGLENIPSTDGVLLLGNHTSWIDWAVLHLAVPRTTRFVMARRYYSRWYVRWFLDLYRVIPISSSASASALRKVTEALQAGDCVILFPEGAISRNGQLGPFRRGYSIPATQTGCPIVPFYLRGLWGSRWSAVTRHFRRSTNEGRTREVNLCFGPPLDASTSPLELKHAVHRLSISAWRDFSRSQGSIPENWLRVVKRHPERLAVADSTGRQVSNEELLAASLTLASRLKTLPETSIGILLPPGTDATLANMGVLLAGKTAVNLDPGLDSTIFSLGLDHVGVTSIITSRTHGGALESRPCHPAVQRCQLWHVEDYRPTRMTVRLVKAAVRILPLAVLRLAFTPRIAPDSTAAVVFSSKKTPRVSGIALTHANIITNARQIASLFPPKGDDVMLSVLPLHHSLGLTMALFLPLLEAIPMACHQDANDCRTVGKTCVEYEATLLCATPAMLAAYVQSTLLHPLMFASLRFVLSGGAGLSEELFQTFRHKFGHVIHDGYGTTETTPLATINAPDVLNPVDCSVQQGGKPGSVGLPLPGSALRVVHPETLEDLPHGAEGRILIGGSQIMKGYIDQSVQAVVVDRDGVRWHVTDDMGRLDEDGFLVVKDV